MTRRRNFLFDVGKVLLDFNFESSLQKLLSPDQTDSEERLARLLEPKDPFERGDIPLEHFISHALDTLGNGITEEQFLDAWRQVFTPNLPMWETVKQLKSDGHGLYLFSNTNAVHCPWFIETYSIFELFEGGTYSFEEGFIKPEPAIYERAISNHNLTAEDTLYIDDLAANIETGKALGFRCHQYDLTDHDGFQTWLTEQMKR